jgi:hypothetical protein
MEAKEIAGRVMADLVAVKAELKDFKGSVKDVIRNIPDVVHSVEKLGADLSLAGSKKKEVAVIIVSKMLGKPWIPNVLIGLAIDAVVAAFNKFGKDWLRKVGVI